MGVEDLADAPAQGDARLAAEREQRVERGAGGGARGVGGEAGEQPELERRREVEDLVTDGDAAARRSAGRSEHAERQVLDREVGMPLGRGHPAAAARLVRVVDHEGVLRCGEQPRSSFRRSDPAVYCSISQVVGAGNVGAAQA